MGKAVASGAAGAVASGVAAAGTAAAASAAATGMAAAGAAAAVSAGAAIGVAVRRLMAAAGAVVMSTAIAGAAMVGAAAVGWAAVSGAAEGAVAADVEAKSDDGSSGINLRRKELPQLTAAESEKRSVCSCSTLQRRRLGKLLPSRSSCWLLLQHLDGTAAVPPEVLNNVYHQMVVTDV